MEQETSVNETSSFAITPPDALGQAIWTPIREPRCIHMLERANGVETEDNMVWIRKTRPSKQIYVATQDGSLWRCATCGTTLLSTIIAHPVWDGPFPGSGGGECEYEKAPYCPTCEPAPSFAGDIIRRQRTIR